MSVRLIILILNAVFFKNSNSNHELVSWISTPRTTKFEDSGSPEICTTNSWVGGMRLKIDSTQGWRDDKGLNAIQLHCVKMDWIYSGHITSASGPWGDYQKSKFCPHGFATGYQLRSEIEAIDDFGVVDFKLKCTNFDGTTSYVINSEYALPWDTCCSEQNCPSKTAVCGLSTQVEVNQGNGRYDCTSSLNNVKLACCKIPDPAETCELEIKWKTVTVCPEARKMCEIKLRTGFVENKKLSKFAKFYKQLGFAIDFQFVQKTFKMKAKNNATYLINGKSLESIIGDTIIYQNKVSLQLNCEGMMQQLIVMCGSYKAYTKEYRCVPNSGQGTYVIFIGEYCNRSPGNSKTISPENIFLNFSFKNQTFIFPFYCFTKVLFALKPSFSNAEK